MILPLTAPFSVYSTFETWFKFNRSCTSKVSFVILCHYFWNNPLPKERGIPCLHWRDAGYLFSRRRPPSLENQKVYSQLLTPVPLYHVITTWHVLFCFGEKKNDSPSLITSSAERMTSTLSHRSSLLKSYCKELVGDCKI